MKLNIHISKFSKKKNCMKLRIFWAVEEGEQGAGGGVLGVVPMLKFTQVRLHI